MFSGITRGLFPVTYVERNKGILIYEIQLTDELLKDLAIGASISVSGVCQTVVSVTNQTVRFEAMQTTLDCTTLDELSVGTQVSIERSLTVGDEIGGHEVSGHITGTASVHAVQQLDTTVVLTIRCPKDWMAYIFSKGFIAIDGSSLTVVEVDKVRSCFTVHLIPETIRVTTLGGKKPGDLVNIELDQRTRTVVDTVKLVMREYMGETI